MIRAKLIPLDFRQLRSMIRPIDVLMRNGWSHRWHCGEVYRGGCPIHRSTSVTSRCFTINAQFWYCHKCKIGGDAVNLYARLNGVTDLEAAHALCEIIGLHKPAR